jgi:ABC-type glycerol-3-phosphate transport system substrate-binding protein
MAIHARTTKRTGVAARWAVAGMAAAMIIGGQAPTIAQEPITITVGAETGPYTQLHMDALAEFTAETGIDVEYVLIPHDDMHQTFLTEALAGTGDIDVFQADQPWVAEFAAAGYLEPLSSRISGEDLADFYPVAMDTVSYNGEIYALPYLVHNSVLYYRTDLFEEAGITAPPTTWEEYRAVAKQLTNADTGVFGTMAEGKQSIEAAAKFLDVVQQAGGSVLDADGNVVFDSPETIDAFNHLLGIQYEDKSSPPGAPGFDNPDTDGLFMDGKLAMTPQWPYMYGIASDPANSKVAGKFKVAVQPGKDADKQSAEVFSWGYGINSASDQKDAAYQFIEWASSPDMLVRLGKAFTNPVPRASAVAAIEADPEVTAEQRDAIATMSESVSLSETIPSNPSWPAIHDRIGVALSKVMSQLATPEEEAAAAAADMRSALGQ